jgi:hypothetical protein
MTIVERVGESANATEYKADGTGTDGCLRHSEGYQADCPFCVFRVKHLYRKCWSAELKGRRAVNPI